MTDGTDRTVAEAPLTGRSIVVTRAAEQAVALAGALESFGADVLLMPVIAVAEPEDWGPVDEAIDSLGSYDWLVLTSRNGVDRFDGRLATRGLALASLADTRVAVVGSATAERLRECGVEPAVTPEEFNAEGLIEALRAAGVGPGTRVLVARAAEAREVLPDELRAAGCEVDVVEVYRLVTAAPPAGIVERLAAGDVDAVAFASGGTARRFAEILRAAGRFPDEVLRSVVIASIGPVTTNALREMGLRADVEASESTAFSLAEALAAYFAKGPA